MPTVPSYDDVFQSLVQDIGDTGSPLTPTTPLIPDIFPDAPSLRNFLHNAVWHRWGVILSPNHVGKTLDSLTQAIVTALGHIVDGVAHTPNPMFFLTKTMHGMSQLLTTLEAKGQKAQAAKAKKKVTKKATPTPKKGN